MSDARVHLMEQPFPLSSQRFSILFFHFVCFFHSYHSYPLNEIVLNSSRKMASQKSITKTLLTKHAQIDIYIENLTGEKVIHAIA